jgi:hypothetical protein
VTGDTFTCAYCRKSKPAGESNLRYIGKDSPYWSTEYRPVEWCFVCDGCLGQWDAILAVETGILEERKAADKDAETLWGFVGCIIAVAVFALCLVIAILLAMLGGGGLWSFLLLGVIIALAVVIAVIVKWRWPD